MGGGFSALIGHFWCLSAESVLQCVSNTALVGSRLSHRHNSASIAPAPPSVSGPTPEQFVCFLTQSSSSSSSISAVQQPGREAAANRSSRRRNCSAAAGQIFTCSLLHSGLQKTLRGTLTGYETVTIITRQKIEALVLNWDYQWSQGQILTYSGGMTLKIKTIFWAMCDEDELRSLTALWSSGTAPKQLYVVIL